ncbi:RsmB/NOP family class I SAM-dependent RNA methyltransferase [Corynebacterium vitaeruminis]|uniref:SAM-dependent MTase RsmB/NOP-type domain-containing protein n=1 Tax=Corynebacterium vitaeruminis DSM 20294 TaxID=1224164 RepID=W5Y1Y8_9CORY|nr:transcription antitermination factor NusB [Corynebacterium vitaeruminis]AHI22880.1 hypothetical protein B843_07475 [Corynebacterium vitaeruminis DSM 20294]
MSQNNAGGFRSRTAKPAGQPGKQQRKPATGKGGEHKRKAPADQHHDAPRRHKPRRQPKTTDGLRDIFVDVDLARAAAFDVIFRVNEDGSYANLALPRLLREEGLKRRDAAFATELTYGTLRTQGVIDAIIAECSSRDLDSIDPGVLAALRLGAYQLLYTRVEPHAAVDTSVRIVSAIGQERAKGFANGILRTISRTTPEKWMEKLTPAGEIESIAFRNAHPEWIARSFAKVVGIGELDAALAADSLRPKVHLVARPGEITAEELALITGGEEGKYSPYAVYLESGDPGQIDPVREGLAAVQDEGSQIIARTLVAAPVEGEDQGRWLDLCAGPGGKAALIGSLARIDGAKVDAVEVSEHRARLIEKSVDGLPVTVHNVDGRATGLTPGFDRVLVDAPCSGLGALRRRPEARWRKQESDIAELNELQSQLLASAVELVRPGGVVVYSTCSPDLRETRGIVDHALATLPVEELDAHALVPELDNAGEEKSIQMWPHRHGTDAMFFAVLRKAAGEQP